MKKPASIAAAIAVATLSFAATLPAAAERPHDLDQPTDAAPTPSGGLLGRLFAPRSEKDIDNMTTGSVVADDKAQALAEAAPHAGGKPFGDIVSRYAAQHGVSEALVHAVIRVESNYRPGARGRAGEIGLMQIKPATARSIGFSGSTKSLHDPATNLRYGIKYLAMAQELGDGSVCGTLLRYNAGHGARRMNPTSAAYCRKVSRFLGEG